MSKETSVMGDVSIARNYHPLEPVRRGYAQNNHQHRCKSADDCCYDFDHDFTFFLTTDRCNIFESRSNLSLKNRVN